MQILLQLGRLPYRPCQRMSRLAEEAYRCDPPSPPPQHTFVHTLCGRDPPPLLTRTPPPASPPRPSVLDWVLGYLLFGPLFLLSFLQVFDSVQGALLYNAAFARELTVRGAYFSCGCSEAHPKRNACIVPANSAHRTRSPLFAQRARLVGKLDRTIERMRSTLHAQFRAR